MPKIVDHAERRGEILQATRRVILTGFKVNKKKGRLAGALITWFSCPVSRLWPAH